MKQIITRAKIDGYNKMIEAARGTCFYSDYALRMEYLNTSGRFTHLGWGNIRYHMNPHDDEQFYIKTVNGRTYIYWEWRMDKERYDITNEVNAQRYFGLEIA